MGKVYHVSNQAFDKRLVVSASSLGSLDSMLPRMNFGRFVNLSSSCSISDVKATRTTLRHLNYIHTHVLKRIITCYKVLKMPPKITG
jgi:hypothetical protein